MTEEEREAIKYLEQIKQDFLNSAKQRKNNGEDTGYGTLEDVDKLSAFEIGIVLNLIQKQQEEIDKKDKIIDEMAEHIVSSAIVDDTVCAVKFCEIEEDCTHEKMLNCTKQYFAKDF